MTISEDPMLRTTGSMVAPESGAWSQMTTTTGCTMISTLTSGLLGETGLETFFQGRTSTLLLVVRISITVQTTGVTVMKGASSTMTTILVWSGIL